MQHAVSVSLPANRNFGRIFGSGLFILALVSALVLTATRNDLSSAAIAELDHAETFDLPSASYLELVDLQTVSAPETGFATLKRGQTLPEALIKSGADRSDAHLAIKALYDSELLDPRRLQIGLTTNTVLGEKTDSGQSIRALTLSLEPGRQLVVKRLGDEFLAVPLDTNMAPFYTRIAAPIDTSLYETARSLGAEDAQIAEFASAFAFDIDFQREIHPGDTFEMVFTSWQDERGHTVKLGDLAYAELHGVKKTKAYYRHTPSDDEIPGWYDQTGESATRFLMKTPINGARLSSNFGRRRHPISGYSRLHKGTDFAAPTGTPVYAAGNGVIERASRYGGYGNYVRIRHANGYQTAYAHLSRYGPGAKKGRSVRQGDVIGYVGSTGRSTGPHLHYEVIIRGNHVNAMSLDLPTGRKLYEAEGMMVEFEAKRDLIDQIREGLGAEIEVIPAVTAALAN